MARMLRRGAIQLLPHLAKLSQEVARCFVGRLQLLLVPTVELAPRLEGGKGGREADVHVQCQVP